MDMTTNGRSLLFISNQDVSLCAHVPENQREKIINKTSDADPRLTNSWQLVRSFWTWLFVAEPDLDSRDTRGLIDACPFDTEILACFIPLLSALTLLSFPFPTREHMIMLFCK